MANNENNNCPHICSQCSMMQQVYCAAQMSLTTMDLVKALSDRFDAFVAEIKGNTEQPTVPPVAQEGKAAQKVGPQDKQNKE